MDVLARLISLPRKGVIAKHHYALDEQPRPRSGEQQRQQLLVRHRAWLSRRDVQAMPGPARLGRHTIGLLGEDQFGEVGLGVVELDPHAPLPRWSCSGRPFARCPPWENVSPGADRL